MDEVNQNYKKIMQAMDRLSGKIHSDEIVIIARTDEGVLLSSNCESVEAIMSLFDAVNEQMGRGVFINPN